MAFSSVKFMGLSVADMKCSLGWGSQVSQITIKLIRDDLDGDVLITYGLGTPVYFEFFSLRFFGLLQSFKEQDSPSGLPTYEAIIVDPREILEGTQIITGGYNNTTGGVRNLLNAYGWVESDSGFGASQSSSAGMPWHLVRAAVENLTSSPTYTDYGGPLSFAGIEYSLDLSELPRPPVYYRITSGSISLLEAIDQICQDSGCDFFIELVGFTIKVRVVSRFHEPPLGTITELTSSLAYTGQVLESQSGVEVRNEITSAFLIGGQKTSIYMGTSLASFWGNDLAGQPYLGTPIVHAGFTTHYCESFNLNAADVADILGQVFYTCNTIEIRWALNGPESWGAYIKKYKPAIYAYIESLYGKDVPFAPQLQHDVVDDALAARNQAIGTAFGVRFERLYDLVRRAGEDFYGKQYLVQIPLVLTALDNETNIVNYSQEPTQSGWVDFGAPSLGIPYESSATLEDADQRVLPFAYYTNLIGANLAQINWSDTVVSAGGEMWSRINIDNKITFVQSIIPVPCVKVRISNPIYDNPIDEYGNIIDAGQVFAPNALFNINDNGFGGTLGYIGLHPAARIPLGLAIPLKSNVESYGPWYIAGAPGKVRFEKDESLTPWDYGSTPSMNLAANSRVLTAITNMQVSETGSVHVAGAPSASLGDILAAGGPNITNLDINFGVSGVSTNYRFQTFTQRFGIFSKQNSERFRRVSLAMVELRKQIRKSINRETVTAIAFERAKRGAKANKTFYTKRQSPHTILMGMGIQNADTNGAPLSGRRIAVGTETYESSLNLLGSGNYTNKALMSWTGLFRPFTTNTSASGNLAKYETPSGVAGGTNNPITNTTYNPFVSGHDIEVVANGNTYNGAHVYHRGVDENNQRPLCLRGPLVIEGWGYGFDSGITPYPNNGSGGFATNTLTRSDLWKVGAVDLLWDNHRKVWTSHDAAIGTVSNTISGSSTGVLYLGGDSGWPINVTNPFSQTLPSGGKAIGLYCFNENKWNLVYPGAGSGSGLTSGNYCSGFVIPSFSGTYNVTGFLTGVYCSGGNVYGITGVQTINVIVPAVTVTLCSAVPINSITVT